MECKKGSRSFRPEVALHHLGLRIPQVHGHKGIKHIDEITVHVETDHLASQLQVLTQQYRDACAARNAGAIRGALVEAEIQSLQCPIQELRFMRDRRQAAIKNLKVLQS
jgi:hypothetical protein